MKRGTRLYTSLLQVRQILLCTVSTCMPRGTEREFEKLPLVPVLGKVLAAWLGRDKIPAGRCRKAKPRQGELERYRRTGW